MAKAEKPPIRFAARADYGKLLAGHETPLGIAAVRAAIVARLRCKVQLPERSVTWSKAPANNH